VVSSQNIQLNPLAVEVNEIIEREAPAVMRMLSDLGKALYYPKGILTQSAEANQKAYRYNATIGEAREEQHSMALPSIVRYLQDLSPDQALPYAPSAGRNDLRAAWLEEIKEKNPSLADIPVSLPVVTSGITHGLSTMADMFIDEGDLLFVPDQVWGNYKLIFGVRRGARLVDYPLLRLEGGLDVEGFASLVKEHAGRGKLVILFNFPNNPTGYSITPAEADALRDILVQAAEGQQCDIVALCDDAYFGLFYDDEVLKESLFTRLAGAHPRVLAVKLDGASKEDYAWGLRVAFITYGISNGAGAYQALEKKTGGCVAGHERPRVPGGEGREVRGPRAARGQSAGDPGRAAVRRGLEALPVQLRVLHVRAPERARCGGLPGEVAERLRCRRHLDEQDRCARGRILRGRGRPRRPVRRDADLRIGDAEGIGRLPAVRPARGGGLPA
jgi:aspartate/methionine/tyrosine aminotransferase